MWARRNCNFATNPGANSCLDGGCNGGLLCDPVTGTGVPRLLWPSSIWVQAEPTSMMVAY
ncbi:hypothetical protein B0H19DRAFT_1100189 [Mycena capillaripes]|nr:hypothetical protein B0H19DRAFT_1100189 [Mycena capillaripes]